MNLQLNSEKVIGSLFIAFYLSLATILVHFSFISLGTAGQAEGVLKTAMILLPRPIVLLYMFLLLIVYYATLYTLWSLFQTSGHSKTKPEKTIKPKEKKKSKSIIKKKR